VSKQVIAVLFALAVPLLWLFGRVLSTDQMFLFRDAGHYYFPLFRLVSEQWAAGIIPLWNPTENGGQPLLASATASIFYPGKLVFTLPLGYATCFKLYVVGHVVLCCITSYLLARSWNRSTLASGLAACSYAFSGTVLFQYCNVIFLVSAAWLPIAFWAADRMLVGRQILWAAVFAVALSMMVLGGDPQTAYHTGLLAAIYAVILWRSGKSSPPLPCPRNLWNRWSHHRLVLLGATALFALGLSAIQVVPSLEWSRKTNRTTFDSPRSIYEIPSYLQRDATDKGDEPATGGLLGRSVAGTHARRAYHFSVGPWRFAEFIWPNISGQMFPENRRWLNALPAEGRVWTPTLYLGLLPLVLATGCIRLRRGNVRTRWMTWTLLLCVLGSLGWYSDGWLLEELLRLVGQSDPERPWLSPPVGGLYWLMTVLLPGFAFFRYPAKLLVPAALAISMLAARGFDRVSTSRSSGMARLLRRLGIVSLGGAIAIYIVSLTAGDQLEKWIVAKPSIFGPLDHLAAARGVAFSLLQTGILAIVFVYLLKQAGQSKRTIQIALVVMTAFDLALAQQSLVVTGPLELWQTPSALAEKIPRSNPVVPPRLFRSSSPSMLPADWLTSRAADRQQKIVRWERDTLRAKYQIDARIEAIETSGTMMSADRQAVFTVAREYGMLEPHRAILDLLGTDFLVLPTTVQLPGTEEIALADHSAPMLAAVRLWRNPHGLPRAWIVHRTTVMQPLRSASRRRLLERTREVLFPDGRPRDFKSEAVVETEHPLDRLANRNATESSESESCQIVQAASDQIRIEATLAAAGLVILSDTYFPGWEAEIHSDGKTVRTAKILRTNRIMRGVMLPAGKHTVVFRYRPTTFRVGAAVSAIAWCALLAVAVWRLSRRPSLD